MFSRRRLLPVLFAAVFALLAFNGAFASNSPVTVVDPATPTMRLLVDSGNEQSILAHGNSKPVELKLVDLNDNPVVGGIVDLIVVNRPSAAKAFKLPATSIKSNPVGIIRLEPFSPTEAGSYRVMAQLRENPAVFTYVDFGVNEENWVMYLIFGLMGGLGMFLFGMNLGADGLQKIAGKKMKSILGTFTNNRYMGVITGILVTAVTQSSSATTVMLVGFVNASLMTISQTLSVIFGANIGTTITVQLIAFEISHFALLMIGAGFILKFSRNKTVLYAGDIIMGFGFIFYGMKIMSVSMSPLRSFPAFREMLLSFSNYPISAIIGSMLFTALIQSSGATIGLVVVFASQGLITLHASIPLILGAHTGTCITGWIAAIGGSAAAKKTALLNVLYNLIGTVIFLPFLYEYLSFSDFVVWCTAPFSSSPAREVANAHMISAILKMIVMFPFYDQIIKLTHLLIPEESSEESMRSVKTKYLSESLLKSPELALGNVAREILRMAGHVEFMMEKVPEMISYGREETIQEVSFREEKVDTAQYEITKYLSSLSEESLTEEQTSVMMRYMSIINELEGQADLIHKIIVPFARAKAREEIRFSEEGFRELLGMFDRSNENFKLIINAFATHSTEQAERVMKSERTFEVLIKRLRTAHMRRVFQHKVQSIETSTLHMDLLQCFKRLNMHSIEMSKAMIVDWYHKNQIPSEQGDAAIEAALQAANEEIKPPGSPVS
ncbi:MAG: Sodium-dependent phosphate transporter [Candidatus Rifleibacterium amylolyticum]|nr:MAG: Sodium-dependent phosphate transporter [Candidatus Rifleibacterium amylolyticum]